MQYLSTSFAIFLIPALISTVSSQQLKPIVNVTAIQENQPFTITCDASRLAIPAADYNVQRLHVLKVLIDTTAHTNHTVAQYTSIKNAPNIEYKNVPLGRDWTVNLSGGNGDTNRHTMKIEILVRDAKCTDAGLYICSVEYYQGSQVKDFSSRQQVPQIAATSEPVLNLEPLNSGPSGLNNYSSYSINDNVTLTCKVNGPQNLTIKWRRERRPPSGPEDMYEEYPFESDITTEPIMQSVTGACVQFQHKSKLNFCVSKKDSYRLFMCAVQVAGVDVATTTAIVDRILITETNPPATATTPAPSPAPEGEHDASVGLIVVFILACLAMFSIVAGTVCILCCRDRSTENENKPDDEVINDERANEEPLPAVDEGDIVETGSAVDVAA